MRGFTLGSISTSQPKQKIRRDYAFILDCEAKRHFGKGDANQFTLDILERLKAQNRVESVRRLAQKQGLNEVSSTVTVQTQDAQGNVVEKQISVADM